MSVLAFACDVGTPVEPSLKSGSSSAPEGGIDAMPNAPGGNHPTLEGGSVGLSPESGPLFDGGGVRPAPYHVQGAQIVDKNGVPYLFRGLDRPSMEWSCSGDIVETDYETMARVWQANVVRLPLNQDCWIQDANNASYDPSYEALVDEQVQWAEKYSMDIILDLHWSDRGDFSVGHNCLANSANCQQDMADAHSVVFWQEVAAKYKGDPHVLFELYNEPRIGGGNPSSNSWDIWLSGGQSSGFTVHGMQELYSTVRNTGANNLVIVGGLDWSYDLSGLTSHALNGTNVIYNTHVYNQNPEDTWYAKFGSFASMYPIIATEFGDHSGSCSTRVVTDFTKYANGNAVGSSTASANKLSWTAWAFYVAQTPCTFPSLLTSDWVTPNAMGQVVQDALIAGP